MRDCQTLGREFTQKEMSHLCDILFGTVFAACFPKKPMVLDCHIEKSEEGLELIIQEAQKFEENHYLDAVRQKRLSGRDILMLTEDVRLWYSRMRKESLKLAAFSEHFLDEFATDNNLRFHEAYDLFAKLRSTISGSRKMFRRFCRRVMKTPTNPRASSSVYGRSLLSANVVALDVFGMDSYDGKVRTLYEEMSAFFTTLVVTLTLCHRMIRDEAVIKGDSQRCYDIYKRCREEILTSARLFAKTFNITVKNVNKDELIERRKNAKDIKEYAKKNYHCQNKSEFLTVTAYEVVSEGSSQGLSEVESMLWPYNMSKAMRVREVISRFDDLVPEDVKNISGILLYQFIKWCGVSPKHEHKLYDYFCQSYKGVHHPVGWTQVLNVRKQYIDSFTDEQLSQSFEKELEKIKKQVA